MRGNELLNKLENIDPAYIEAAGQASKKKKNTWVKWGAIAACLCLVIVGTISILQNNNKLMQEGSTLMGENEIYPTVMVNGECFEWRKGAAIQQQLPNGAEYYGDVVHTEEKAPVKDCEFASVFEVSGKIYLLHDNRQTVYLRLTTSWLDNVVVAFDHVE